MAIPDITVNQAWEILEKEPNAVLIDVRTDGEWDDVGIPDVSAVGREMRLVQWITQPGSVPNENFLEEASADLDRDTPIVVLCRSGVRSQAAGSVMADAGFTKAFNVLGGFEGSAQNSGWKENLPWKNR